MHFVGVEGSLQLPSQPDVREHLMIIYLLQALLQGIGSTLFPGTVEPFPL